MYVTSGSAHRVGCCCLLLVGCCVLDVLAGHTVVFDIKATGPTVLIIGPSSACPSAILVVLLKSVASEGAVASTSTSTSTLVELKLIESVS